MVLSLSKMGDSGGRWSFLAGSCGVGKAEGGACGGVGGVLRFDHGEAREGSELFYFDHGRTRQDSELLRFDHGKLRE